MSARDDVLAVVLAAGAGTRFSGPTHKLLAPFRATTVVGAAVGAALRARLDVAVVYGAVDLSRALPVGVALIENPRWREGQATSLALAVDAARAMGRDLVVGLGDQPLVPAEAWEAVAATTDRPIATATFGGERRPPVRFAAAVFDLLPRTGDMGARHVIADHPELVIDVPCAGTAADVDTVEDLEGIS